MYTSIHQNNILSKSFPRLRFVILFQSNISLFLSLYADARARFRAENRNASSFLMVDDIQRRATENTR